MSKIIGINQAGRIGDIIISLPIAKYYHDNGYKVIWTVAKPFIGFLSDAVDYVDFIPIRHNNISDTANWHIDGENILKKYNCERILNLLYNMEGTDKQSGEWKNSGLKFDEYRYKVADVPFEEKWNLKIKRNKKRENDLFQQVVKMDKHVTYQVRGTAFYKPINLQQDPDHQMIEINPVTNNPFDWLKIIETSSRLVLIDSSFANIVEQLNFTNKKWFLLRSPDIMTPTLRNEWEIIK